MAHLLGARIQVISAECAERQIKPFIWTLHTNVWIIKLSSSENKKKNSVRVALSIKICLALALASVKELRLEQRSKRKKNHTLIEWYKLENVHFADRSCGCVCVWMNAFDQILRCREFNERARLWLEVQFWIDIIYNRDYFEFVSRVLCLSFFFSMCSPSDNYVFVFENILRILRCTLHCAYRVFLSSRIEFLNFCSKQRKRNETLVLIYCFNSLYECFFAGCVGEASIEFKSGRPLCLVMGKTRSDEPRNLLNGWKWFELKLNIENIIRKSVG